MQLIALAVAALAAAEPDFTRDIAPVLERCCVECHRPGGPGAYDFTRPAEVKRVVRTLLAAVESGAMPPFLPVEGVVTVPPRPSVDEIATLKAWVERGAEVEGAGELRSPAAPGTRTPIAAWEVADGWLVGAGESRVMRSFVVGVAERPLLVGGWRIRAETPGLVARTLLAAGDATLARSLDERDANLGFKLTGDLATRPAGGVGSVGIDGVFAFPDGFAIPIAAGEAIVVECHADGRGKDESAAFRLEAMPPVAVGDEPIRMLRAMTVGCGGEVRERRDGATVASDLPPLERDVDLASIVLRPGMHAVRVHLRAVGPDGGTTTLLRIDRWDGHVDRPYRVDPPFRVARGTRLSLETVAENEVLAVRSTPQAVLLVAEAVDAKEPVLPDRGAILPAIRPGPATAAFLASALPCGEGDARLLATPLVPATVFREVFGVDPEPRTGPTDAAGLTWFAAIDLCNELSRRDGLPLAYRIEFAERDGPRLVSAVITPLGGTGWRLPCEAEWAATFACRDGLPGALWNWTGDTDGSARVVRGGCWADPPGTQGQDARSSVPPATRNELFGARFVRFAEGPGASVP